MVTGIIIAAAVVGILGILIGIFLGIASEKFKVEVCLLYTSPSPRDCS